MNHLMIDLETLSTSPYGVILSVGLVAFDKDIIIAQKEWFLNVDQQIAQGRKIDYATISWWMAQSEEAKSIFKKGMTTSLSYFCNEAMAFYKMNCADGKVWGNGANFDPVLLETLFHKNGLAAPWKYWDVRCYRTVKSMFGNQMNVSFEGIKHGALADSLHQAKCLQKLFTERPELA